MRKFDGHHLSLTQRMEIEQGLKEGKSYAEIARNINKNPGTISREVSRNAKRKDITDSSRVPCANRPGCHMRNLCNDRCEVLCKMCGKWGIKCSDYCSRYVPIECQQLLKPPHVCNGCKKRSYCMIQKVIYSAKHADDRYREQLSSCREGINQTPESIQRLDSLVSPLLMKGQSLSHIYATHAEEIGCSRRTLYTYIDQSVLTARNIDLRRRVKYKPRRKPTRCVAADRKYRHGRSWDDFQKMLRDSPDPGVVQMDTVEGRKGGKVFLTMLFLNCSLMLIFLLEKKTQDEVIRVFDHLTEQLGVELFRHTFPVILTDAGSEFQDPAALEHTQDGQKRTRIYFCNPYSSWQKGAIEKNHEYIRHVLPKGTSLDFLDQEKTTILTNHINSEARDSLNGCTPFKLSLLLLDNRLRDVLSLSEVPADEVMLLPRLLK